MFCHKHTEKNLPGEEHTHSLTLQAISPLFAMRILSKVCGKEKGTGRLRHLFCQHLICPQCVCS